MQPSNKTRIQPKMNSIWGAFARRSGWTATGWRKAAAQSKAMTMLLVVLAALAVGAGAAVGNAMRGEVDGTVPITVAQALIVQRPQSHNFPPDRKFFGSTSDDQTKFSFAVEMFRGESLTVLIPIVNRSSGDTVAQFSVIVPEVPSLVEGVPGLTLDMSGSGLVDDVVRVSPDSWTFTADANLAGLSATPPDGVLLTINVSQTAMSGFFEITGRIRTVEF